MADTLQGAAPSPQRLPDATRRVLFARVLAVLGAAAAQPVLAQAARPRVDEDDDTAKSLGYRHDATAVDMKKYPKHNATQKCLNCSFYQAAPAEPWGGCAFFGRRQVAGAGWCVAWQPKPAG